jgi:hypothetical protein
MIYFDERGEQLPGKEKRQMGCDMLKRTAHGIYWKSME